MGRWTHFRLDGKHNTHINIICAYRVCPPSRQETSTSNTAYLQQLRHLRLNNNTTCPREQLLDDLSTIISSWNDNNKDTILLIDANEPTSHNNSWSRFLQRNNLYNAHSFCQQDTPPTPPLTAATRSITSPAHRE